MSSRNTGVGKFVDTELLVVQWLTYKVLDADVATVVPNPLPANGLLWVSMVGGVSDWDEANPVVDVQIMMPGNYGSATALAAEAHNAMNDLGGTTVNGQFVNYVRCRSIPTRHFWGPDVDRLVATYELSLPVL